MHTAYYFTPTDHSTASVDEFLASCRSMPEVASQHLVEGYFEAWLRDQGRHDLAERAAAARFEADGLTRFLKAPRTRRAPAAKATGATKRVRKAA